LFQAQQNCSWNHWMLKEAFGKQALCQARTFEWFTRFKDARKSVDNRKHSGQPSACTAPETIVNVREVILQDTRQTLHDVCKRTGLSQANVNAFYQMNGDWLLHHDNVPVDTSLIVREFLTKKKTWPLFPTLPTNLTWPPAISVCSLKWNSSWKGSISYPLKRSKQNCNRY
jgi:hypothetical protein